MSGQCKHRYKIQKSVCLVYTPFTQQNTVSLISATLVVLFSHTLKSQVNCTDRMTHWRLCCCIDLLCVCVYVCGSKIKSWKLCFQTHLSICLTKFLSRLSETHLHKKKKNSSYYFFNEYKQNKKNKTKQVLVPVQFVKRHHFDLLWFKLGTSFWKLL